MPDTDTLESVARDAARRVEEAREVLRDRRAAFAEAVRAASNGGVSERRLAEITGVARDTIRRALGRSVS